MKQVINIRFNYSQWSIFFPQIIYNACDFWLECSNFDSELVLFLLHCLRFCSGGNYKILLTIFRPLFILFSFNKMWWILMRLSKSHFYFVAFMALNHYYGAHPAAGKWVCLWFWWTFKTVVISATGNMFYSHFQPHVMCTCAWWIEPEIWSIISRNESI